MIHEKTRISRTTEAIDHLVYYLGFLLDEPGGHDVVIGFFFSRTGFAASPHLTAPRSEVKEKETALKGHKHEIFYLWFFHESIVPGPWIHMLKYFCLCGDIHEVRFFS